MGTVVSVNDAGNDCLQIIIETRECWPGGETLVERHEIRHYATPIKSQLDASKLYGKVVSISGRIRLKDPSHTEYRPYIHCHKIECVDLPL